MLIAVVIALVWAVCGVLAFGIFKDSCRLLMQRADSDKRLNAAELAEINRSSFMFGLAGPFGLVLSAVHNKTFRSDFYSGSCPVGVCYKMPKELCEA